jgi:hypothetical protein
MAVPSTTVFGGTWGPWDYATTGNNAMRVGIDFEWDTPAHGSTTVVLRTNFWTQNRFNYDDNQTMTFSGVNTNDATNYLNKSGSSTSEPDAPKFRFTRSYTYTYPVFPAANAYHTSPGSHTVGASVSNVVTAGVAPSHSRSITIPARPGTTPGSPSVSSSPNNGSVTITVGAPSFDGYAPLSYEYSTNNVFYEAMTANPFTVNGTNGTAVTVWVRARNDYGTSAPTSATSTPRTTPGTPGVSSSPANGSISVSYSAPASDGGNAISSYQFSTDGTNYSTITSNPFSVSGTNGTAITVSVRAVNAAGTGGAASTTNTPRTVSGPPTSFAGDSSVFGQITLTWGAPSNNGGATITSYILRNGSTILQSANLTSFTHTGLLPFTDYSYTVVAVNASGEGNPASLTVKTMGGIAKVWNGTSWVTVLPKVWNGTSWADAQARMWNGTEWKHGI